MTCARVFCAGWPLQANSWAVSYELRHLRHCALHAGARALQALRSYDLSVEGPRQPSTAGPAAIAPQAAFPIAPQIPSPAADTDAAVAGPAAPAPVPASSENHVTLIVAVVLAALLAAALTALGFCVAARHRRKRKEKHGRKASVTELDDISHDNCSNGTHLSHSPPEVRPPTSCATHSTTCFHLEDSSTLSTSLSADAPTASAAHAHACKNCSCAFTHSKFSTRMRTSERDNTSAKALPLLRHGLCSCPHAGIRYDCRSAL